MAVVTTLSGGVADSAQSNFVSKWGNLQGCLSKWFKGKFESTVEVFGLCMQHIKEVVAYFRLRNQKEEQRLMHIINGNVPAKTRAVQKIKKGPTPNITKVKIVSVMESQQIPKASHVYDTLRHLDAKRMNEIGNMPCHEIVPAIEKWRKESPKPIETEPSTKPANSPVDEEFQPVVNRRQQKAAKREANLAAKRKLDPSHWNAPILTAPPVRGVDGVYLAGNSDDAEGLVTGGLFHGYNHAGKLAVLLLGTPSNSLLAAAQRHHINPVPCSIPVMKGTGTYVEAGFVWQIGQEEVKSVIAPLAIDWSSTKQPTIVAVDVARNHAPSQLWGRLAQAWKSVEMSREHEEWKKQQQKLGKKPWQALNDEMTAMIRAKGGDEAVNVSVYGAKLNALFKGDTFTATFRASDALIEKLRACSGIDGVAFRRTSFGNTEQYDKEETEETKVPFPASLSLEAALEQLKLLPGHRGLFFKRDGHSLIARIPKSSEEAAWKLIASRDVPGKAMYEIDQLPRAIAPEDLAAVLKQDVHWDAEVVRVKTCGTKQSPWKKAIVRASMPPSHTFLQMQGRICTIRPMTRDPIKPTGPENAPPAKDFAQLAQERKQSFYATIKPAQAVISPPHVSQAAPMAVEPTPAVTTGVDTLQKVIVNNVLQELGGQLKDMVSAIQATLMEQYKVDQANMQQQIEQLSMDTVQRKAPRTQE